MWKVRRCIIDYRFAEGKYEGLPDLARELVRLRVDIIMVFTIPATRAARSVTTTTPIVFAQALDPQAWSPGSRGLARTSRG